MLPGCLVFVVVGVVAFADEPLLGVAAILLGGGYIALSLTAWFSRRVALAVTAEGITLASIRGRAVGWCAVRPDG